MKKRILILGGGISGERSISLKTAKAVENCIKKKYNCKIDMTFLFKKLFFTPFKTSLISVG